MLQTLTEQHDDPESPIVREAVALMQQIDAGHGAVLREDRARVVRAIQALGAPRGLQTDN